MVGGEEVWKWLVLEVVFVGDLGESRMEPRRESISAEREEGVLDWGSFCCSFEEPSSSISETFAVADADA